MSRGHVAGVVTATLVAAVGCGSGARVSPSAEPTDPAAPRVVVEVPKTTVPAGEYAEALVRVENLGSAGVLDVTFGDNGPGGGSSTSDTPCGPIPGNVFEHRIRHPYRYAGTWTVTATFRTQLCGGSAPLEYRGTATVEVTPADVPTNGPERPRLSNIGENPHGATPGMTRVQASVEEPDGYLTEMRYAWGDGSPDTVFTFPLDKCVDPPDRWPYSGSPASLDDTEWTDPEHRYPHPGDYEVTVTAVSTGCDGGERQEATKTVTVTAKASG